MEMKPFGVAALPGKPDFSLGESNLDCTHCLTINLKFCIGIKEYFVPFYLNI